MYSCINLLQSNGRFEKVWLHYFSGGPEELLSWGGGELVDVGFVLLHFYSKKSELKMLKYLFRGDLL